jgi:transcriptional regulator with XRE-family HTH domain
MVTRIGPRRPFRLYIREWIEHKELEQKQVAERMGCEPGTLSKLISGKMRRTDEWLAAIAYALDIDVERLFQDPNLPTQEDLLRGLPEEKRKEVTRVIRVLTGTDA